MKPVVSEQRQVNTRLTHFEAPVVNGTLMEWETTTVPNGAYFLRLVIVDNTGNYWAEIAEIRIVVTN